MPSLLTQHVFGDMGTSWVLKNLILIGNKQMQNSNNAVKCLEASMNLDEIILLVYFVIVFIFAGVVAYYAPLGW